MAQLGEELVERVRGVRVAAALSLAAAARRVRRGVTSPFAVSARRRRVDGVARAARAARRAAARAWIRA